MTSTEEQAAPRVGYRGKCLYKTGKCTNERALKTSGAPHNLCEEHRNRQNEHQRKLDAKNRTNRKEKRAKARTRQGPYGRNSKRQATANAVGQGQPPQQPAPPTTAAAVAAATAANAAAALAVASQIQVQGQVVGQMLAVPPAPSSVGNDSNATDSDTAQDMKMDDDEDNTAAPTAGSSVNTPVEDNGQVPSVKPANASASSSSTSLTSLKHDKTSPINKKKRPAGDHIASSATASSSEQTNVDRGDQDMDDDNNYLPQAPQLSYPVYMKDFDGIVVPLPSYLEGNERIEFRSRVYQKVMDFISEEYVLRFANRLQKNPTSPHSPSANANGKTAGAGSATSKPKTEAEAVVAASGNDTKKDLRKKESITVSVKL